MPSSTYPSRNGSWRGETEALERVVRNAAALLAEYSGEGPLARIAASLHQEAGEQTERMAAAICVSAFVFHGAIDGQEGIPPIPLAGSIDKGSLLRTWNSILKVNYWPIFSVARDLVQELPLMAIPPVMDRIADSISDLARLGVTTYHDLTGRMFQTLISDRKFLATFYTLPESACLLAELAVERLDVDWSDRTAIEGLRIADFACGTGALLSAVQRAVYRRYRRAGGNDGGLHRALMERVLTGLDIMPPPLISPARCCPAPTPRSPTGDPGSTPCPTASTAAERTSAHSTFSSPTTPIPCSPRASP